MSFWGDLGQTVLDVGTVGLDRVAGDVLDSTKNHYQQATPGGTAYTDQMAQAGQQAQTGYDQQQAFIAQLQQQALGGGPSVAEQMLARQTQANMQNNASAIASQRGMNPALASKLLLDQNAAAQQNAAGQGAQMRAGEMLNSQGLLGNMLNQSRGQSLGAWGQAGGLTNQAVLGAGQINSGVAAGNAATNGALVGGALNGAGALMGMPGAGAIAGKVAGVGGQAAYGSPDYNAHVWTGGAIGGGAPVPGDSPANDVVPAKLSPGEVVLPRSVMQSADPEAAAVAFLRSIRGLQAHAGGYADGGEVSDPFSPSYSGVDSLPAARPDPAPAVTPEQQAALDANAQAMDGTVFGDPALARAVALKAPPAPPADLGGATVAPAPSASSWRGPPVWGAGSDKPPAGPPTASGLLYELTAGEKQQQAGIKAYGVAKAAQYEHEAKVAEAGATALAEMKQKHEEVTAQRQAQADKMFSDYSSGQIDPNRYWNSQGTGQKISAGIGLILGGIGAGLTHGPNLALQVIDRAIDRDMEAQKLNMGKQANALSYYLQQTGDIRLAQQLAKADAKDVTAAQMQAAALQSGSPEIKAQTEQLVGATRADAAKTRLSVQAMQMQMEQQKMQMAAQRFQFQQMQGLAANGGNVDPKVIPFLPKETRELVAPIGNGKYGLARTPKDAEEVTKSTEMTNTLREKLQRYGQMLVAHPHGQLLPDAEADAAKALRESILTDINGLAGLTRFTETEKDIFSGRVPDITKMQVTEGHQAKLGELAKDIDAKVRERNATYMGVR